MRRFLYLLCILAILHALLGCSTTLVAKVPEPPVITTPARPDLTGKVPSEQVRGLYDYILQLESALKQAAAALDAYRRAN